MRRALLSLLVLLPLLAFGQTIKKYNSFNGFSGGMSVKEASALALSAGATLEGNETHTAAYALGFNGGFLRGMPIATWVMFFDREALGLISIGIVPTSATGFKTRGAVNEVLQGFSAGFGRGIGQAPRYSWDPDGTLRAGFSTNGLKIMVAAMQDDDGLWAVGLFVFFAEGVQS